MSNNKGNYKKNPSALSSSKMQDDCVSEEFWMKLEKYVSPISPHNMNFLDELRLENIEGFLRFAKDQNLADITSNFKFKLCNPLDGLPSEIRLDNSFSLEEILYNIINAHRKRKSKHSMTHSERSTKLAIKESLQLSLTQHEVEHLNVLLSSSLSSLSPTISSPSSLTFLNISTLCTYILNPVSRHYKDVETEKHFLKRYPGLAIKPISRWSELVSSIQDGQVITAATCVDAENKIGERNLSEPLIPPDADSVNGKATINHSQYNNTSIPHASPSFLSEHPQYQQHLMRRPAAYDSSTKTPIATHSFDVNDSTTATTNGNNYYVSTTGNLNRPESLNFSCGDKVSSAAIGNFQGARRLKDRVDAEDLLDRPLEFHSQDELFSNINTPCSQTVGAEQDDDYDDNSVDSHESLNFELILQEKINELKCVETSNFVSLHNLYRDAKKDEILQQLRGKRKYYENTYQDIYQSLESNLHGKLKDFNVKNSSRTKKPKTGLDSEATSTRSSREKSSFAVSSNGSASKNYGEFGDINSTTKWPLEKVFSPDDIKRQFMLEGIQIGACWASEIKFPEFIYQLKTNDVVEMFVKSVSGCIKEKWTIGFVKRLMYDNHNSRLRYFKVCPLNSFPGDMYWIGVEDGRIAPPGTHISKNAYESLGLQLHDSTLATSNSSSNSLNKVSSLSTSTLSFSKSQLLSDHAKTASMLSVKQPTSMGKFRTLRHVENNRVAATPITSAESSVTTLNSNSGNVCHTATVQLCSRGQSYPLHALKSTHDVISTPTNGPMVPNITTLTSSLIDESTCNTGIEPKPLIDKISVFVVNEIIGNHADAISSEANDLIISSKLSSQNGFKLDPQPIAESEVVYNDHSSLTTSNATSFTSTLTIANSKVVANSIDSSALISESSIASAGATNKSGISPGVMEDPFRRVTRRLLQTHVSSSNSPIFSRSSSASSVSSTGKSSGVNIQEHSVVSESTLVNGGKSKASKEASKRSIAIANGIVPAQLVVSARKSEASPNKLNCGVPVIESVHEPNFDILTIDSTTPPPFICTKDLIIAQDSSALLPFDAVIEKAFSSSNRIDLLRNYATSASTNKSLQPNLCSPSVMNSIDVFTLPPARDSVNFVDGNSIPNLTLNTQSATSKPRVGIRAGATTSHIKIKQSNSKSQGSNQNGRSFVSDMHIDLKEGPLHHKVLINVAPVGPSTSSHVNLNSGMILGTTSMTASSSSNGAQGTMIFPNNYPILHATDASSPNNLVTETSVFNNLHAKQNSIAILRSHYPVHPHSKPVLFGGPFPGYKNTSFDCGVRSPLPSVTEINEIKNATSKLQLPSTGAVSTTSANLTKSQQRIVPVNPIASGEKSDHL